MLNLRQRDPAGFKIPAETFISNDSEPETQSAENFEIMVQLNKAKENDWKHQWKLVQAYQFYCLNLPAQFDKLYLWTLKTKLKGENGLLDIIEELRPSKILRFKPKWF